MIEKRKILKIGASRYILLPRDFKIEPEAKLIIIHNQLIGFATPEIANMSQEAFDGELKAVTRLLVDARKILKSERENK